MNLDKIFAECADPTHASSKEVHAMLVDLLAVTARTQQQVIEYRQLLTVAEFAADAKSTPGASAGVCERLHQTLRRMERDAQEFQSLGRRLALMFTQFDRYIAEYQTNSNTLEANDA